jgi:hypothetical protein
VGYDKDSMHAHCIYWPNKHRVLVERDVKFAPLVSTIQVPSVSPLIDQTTPLTAILTPTQQALQPTRAVSVPLTPISMPISGQTLVGSMLAKEDSIIEDKGEAPVHEAMVQSQPPTPQQHATVALQPQRRSSTQAARASTQVSKPLQYVKQLAKGEGSMDGKGKKAVPGFRGWHPDSLSICTNDANPQDFIFSTILVDVIIFTV